MKLILSNYEPTNMNVAQMFNGKSGKIVHIIWLQLLILKPTHKNCLVENMPKY